MFDHVTIRVADRAASERFYDTVLAPLGVDRTYRTGTFSEWRDFSLTGADDANPPTRRLHIAFAAPTPEQLEDFWRTAGEAGYADGTTLQDPDGNGVEAVYNEPGRGRECLEHLRIRVADLDASRRFYATIAPFIGDGGSFSLEQGTPPTEHLHMAFPADDDALVQGFHAAALDAGYADNGPPGERPRYHRGYYAAYVLDPDGNNIELVNHHRS